MLGHNVDPAVRAAWLEDMFLPPDVLEWAPNAVVVCGGGRTILIDAGIGTEFPDLPRAGQWAQRLEAAGVGHGCWIDSAIRSAGSRSFDLGFRVEILDLVLKFHPL